MEQVESDLEAITQLSKLHQNNQQQQQAAAQAFAVAAAKLIFQGKNGGSTEANNNNRLIPERPLSLFQNVTPTTNPEINEANNQVINLIL